MDREILFRGKRLDNGEWVEGYLIRGERTYIVSSDDVGYMVVDLSGMASLYPIDFSTVGQYTGLTDKNGVKIFEGDILNENGEHFTVVYDTKWAKFKLQYTHFIQYPEWNRGVLMEVIGNIHDNPELIGGEDDG